MKGTGLLILTLLAIVQQTAHAKTACNLQLLSMGIVTDYVTQRPGELNRALADVVARTSGLSDPVHEVLSPIRELEQGVGNVGRTPEFMRAQTVSTALKKLEAYRTTALAERRAKMLAAAQEKAETEASTTAAERVEKPFEMAATTAPELWKEATGGQVASLQDWQNFQSHGSFASSRKGEITFAKDESAQVSMRIVKNGQEEKLVLKMGSMKAVEIKWPASRNEDSSQALLANLLEDHYFEDGELNLAKSDSVTNRMHLHQFMFGVVSDNMTVSLPRGASADPNAGKVSQQIRDEISAASLSPQAESAYWSARNQLNSLSRVLNMPPSSRQSMAGAWSQTETEIVLGSVVRSVGVMHDAIQL